MGVRGLWRLLEPAQEVTTLAELADRAFRSSPGTRGFRLGIDAPLWLVQAQEKVGRLDPQIVGRYVRLMLMLSPFEKNPSAEPNLICSLVRGCFLTSNAAVRVLFFRLCALFRKGILAVFVFDGSEGPQWKRGMMSGPTKGVPSELEKQFTVLLTLCGVPWRKARGEAEAELAEMAKQGFIDAVLTVSTLLNMS